jgi:hypothetical protein
VLVWLHLLLLLPRAAAQAGRGVRRLLLLGPMLLLRLPRSVLLQQPWGAVCCCV